MTDKIRDKHVYKKKEDDDKQCSSESSEEEDEAAMQAALWEMVQTPDIDCGSDQHSSHTKPVHVEEHRETWAERLKRNARIPLLQAEKSSTNVATQASSSCEIQPKQRQRFVSSPRKPPTDLTVQASSGTRVCGNQFEKTSETQTISPKKPCKPVAHTSKFSPRRESSTPAEENCTMSETDNLLTQNTLPMRKCDIFSESMSPIDSAQLMISTVTDPGQQSIVAKKLKMLRLEKAARPKVYGYPDRVASTQTWEKQTVTVATNTEGEFFPNSHMQQRKEDSDYHTGIINILTVPCRRTLNYETVREQSELPNEDMTTPMPPELTTSAGAFRNLPKFGRSRLSGNETEMPANEGQAKEQAENSRVKAEHFIEKLPKVTLNMPETCTGIKESICLLAPKAFGRESFALTATGNQANDVALNIVCPKKPRKEVRAHDPDDIATSSQQAIGKVGSTLTKSRSVTPVTSATQLFLPSTSSANPDASVLSIAAQKVGIRKVLTMNIKKQLTTKPKTEMSSQQLRQEGEAYIEPLSAAEPTLDMKDSISTALVRLFVNALVPDEEYANEEKPKSITRLNEVIVVQPKTENNDQNPEAQKKDVESVNEDEPVRKSDSMRTLTIIGRDSHIRTKYEDHCHFKDRPEGFDRTAWRKLIFASILCVCFMIVEVIGGILSNSLAIATDAAHLLTDLAGFMISLFAIYLAGRPSSQRLNFGWYRAEVLGALISVYFIWVITGILVYLAVQRLMTGEHEVNAIIMLITSGMAIAVNVIMACQLHHGHSHGADALNEANRMPRTRHVTAAESLASSNTLLMDREQHILSPSVSTLDAYHQFHQIENINVRAAFVHVIGDIVQSVGVFVAAIIIFFKPTWAIVDSICTFVFSIIVLVVTFRILRDVIMVLMEATPDYMDYEEVQRLFLSIDGVVHVHNLRIWALSIDKIALSAHLAIRKDADPQVILEMAKRLIHRRYNLFETTIQIEEYTPSMEDCEHCQLPGQKQNSSNRSDEKNINIQ